MVRCFFFFFTDIKVHTCDAHRFRVVKSVKKRTLKIPSHRCEYNINIVFQEIGLEGVDSIMWLRNRDKWGAVVNTLMKFQIPQNAGNFLTSWQTSSSME
jgi:hypothetical protein